MKEKVLPEMNSSDSFFLIVIDNLRLDQWEVIEPLIAAELLRIHPNARRMLKLQILKDSGGAARR